MRIGDRSLPDCEESPCDCYFEGSDDLAMVRMACRMGRESKGQRVVISASSQWSVARCRTAMRWWVPSVLGKPLGRSTPRSE